MPKTFIIFQYPKTNHTFKLGDSVSTKIYRLKSTTLKNEKFWKGYDIKYVSYVQRSTFTLINFTTLY
jgi:hypothetical protein